MGFGIVFGCGVVFGWLVFLVSVSEEYTYLFFLSYTPSWQTVRRTLNPFILITNCPKVAENIETLQSKARTSSRENKTPVHSSVWPVLFYS